MSEYTINLKNESGNQVKAAIYQVYPDVQGYSLTWLVKDIDDSNNYSFEWEIDWGVNWGTSAQQLAPGIMFTSGGPLQEMDPTSAAGANAMGITSDAGGFKTQPTAKHDPSVAAGSIQVSTDTSFSTTDATTMSVAVYMNSLPAFAMQGKPNGKYTFNTHPTYYICTTEHDQGVAVDGTFISAATKIVFADGATALSYTLNKELQFVLQPSAKTRK